MNKKEIKGQISSQPQEWVHEVLEPEQLTTARPRFERRQLRRNTFLLLWGLRIYVFLMVILIALQVWNALHVGG